MKKIANNPNSHRASWIQEINIETAFQEIRESLSHEASNEKAIKWLHLLRKICYSFYTKI